MMIINTYNITINDYTLQLQHEQEYTETDLNNIITTAKQNIKQETIDNKKDFNKLIDILETIYKFKITT